MKSEKPDHSDGKAHLVPRAARGCFDTGRGAPACLDVRGLRWMGAAFSRAFGLHEITRKEDTSMETRVAVLAVIVRAPASVAALNALLHQYEDCVLGRMGIPCRERGIRLISVALDAPADRISALSGKIGRLPGVTAKTVYAPEDKV